MIIGILLRYILKPIYSYGEIGTYILSQLLFKLFPDELFLPDCTLPLCITEFRWRVLLPEAAAKLIMDDTHVDHHTAVRTMRRSGRYGATAFPYDDQDVYDEMIKELVPPQDSDAPRDQFTVLPSSLNETASVLSGHAGHALSDDDHAPDVSLAQPADPFAPITILTIPSDVDGDAGSSQMEQRNSGSDVANSVDLRSRRRKLPRSMIPIILTKVEEEDSSGDDEKLVLKKRRLA